MVLAAVNPGDGDDDRECGSNRPRTVAWPTYTMRAVRLAMESASYFPATVGLRSIIPSACEMSFSFLLRTFEAGKSRR